MRRIYEDGDALHIFRDEMGCTSVAGLIVTRPNANITFVLRPTENVFRGWINFEVTRPDADIVSVLRPTENVLHGWVNFEVTRPGSDIVSREQFMLLLLMLFIFLTLPEDESASAIPEDEPSSAVPEDEPSSAVSKDEPSSGTDESKTYLQRYLLELDPQHTALVGRHSRKPWTKFINDDNHHLALREIAAELRRCIEVDEVNGMFFLSETNHHRIIVFASNGEILDSIESSPGFEDGEFESSKIMRPAALLYDDAEYFLYFVD
ncbi:hypothetical protein Tco_0184088 [Tanacetum coccineum]